GRHGGIRIGLGVRPWIGRELFAGRGLRVVPRVNMVFDEVVTLRMIAEWAAALFIHERVRHRICAQVCDVSEGKRKKLLRLFDLSSCGERLCLSDEGLTQGRGTPVVTHITPKEKLLVEPLLYAGIE